MQAEQAAQADQGGAESGDPLAQQRRRLLAEPQASAQAGGYLFDWEKKPAKLLPFVSSDPRW